MINAFIDFYLKSHPITLSVLALLSIYFLVLNWVFFYRYFSIGSWVQKERASLESLLMGASSVSETSFLKSFLKTTTHISKEIFDLAMLAATKETTKGLVILSIFASTSPFIGLFGTVVSILDTFSHIGTINGGMSIIASGVSDALVATAAGIFVAIFAYTYHQILKRKSFELVTLLQMQCDAILSQNNNSESM
ncbi:MotA/TolQ/ExbB proton channel family protein [hydrothermal vent metagenome]|uniref:MotA/TolQ/ExbB proton channel family protein n=1 Tax=hydrothermal vent metagenome TaxID=652676 RepID=A0A1W1D2W7_9ZZZZ